MARREQIGDATLYLGDCREILPLLGRVDAVVTDPPYGVDFTYEGRTDSKDEWRALMVQVVPRLKSMARGVVMPACRQLALPWWYATFPPDWLICWYKGASPTLSPIGFADWEAHLVWGKPARQIHDYCGVMATSTDYGNGHPCPKPIRYAEWFVSRFADAGQTICDPFMGSGTTGVACANLGRKFIGIEIEPKYFNIACERITMAYAQGKLFA